MLGLEKQKLKEGKDLIRFFCAPGKGKGRNARAPLPGWRTGEMGAFQGVQPSVTSKRRWPFKRGSPSFPAPDSLWAEYVLDQEINDRGIQMDMKLVREAIRCDEQFKQAHLNMGARGPSGLENPNSPTQLKAWLTEQGVQVDSLSKAAVLEMLEKAEGRVELALSLRQELAKSSVKKFTAMKNVVCPR